MVSLFLLVVSQSSEGKCWVLVSRWCIGGMVPAVQGLPLCLGRAVPALGMRFLWRLYLRCTPSLSGEGMLGASKFHSAVLAKLRWTDSATVYGGVGFGRPATSHLGSTRGLDGIP